MSLIIIEDIVGLLHFIISIQLHILVSLLNLFHLLLLSNIKGNIVNVDPLLVHFSLCGSVFEKFQVFCIILLFYL